MWSTVLVMAAVAGTDPLRIGVVAYMVSRRRPVRLLLPFLLVGFAVNVVVGAVVLFGLRDVSVGGGAGIPAAAEIAVGAIALLIAVLAATGVLERGFDRLRGRHDPVPAATPGAPGQDRVTPPTLDTLPIVSKLPASIKAALRGEAAWAAGLLGLSNGIPTPYYLAAMAAALTSGAAVGQQLAALIVFNLIAFAAALIPIVSFWIAPDATRSVVERIYAAMRTHHRLVVSVIAGAVGVFFLAMGIGHL
ncbi:GAP family protein [Mycobacterium sp. NPDC003449]